ncbi:MAG TPA: BTAD domain-containing putative transcriptional regulator, partial [Nocardioides sp.]|nr:BTAD domain-containing putative transcriptional regulator [Nocardioides sp.]
MTTERNALALRVDVLGPLELHVEGRDVPVPGTRRRALLALLALEGGRPVGARRLVDSLWPDDVPDNALQALYNHVSRLRGHLGPLAGRLERAGTGYRLSLLPDELDVDAVRRITATASDAGSLRAALDLWRGPALEEFGEMPALQAERVGLDELRATVLDQLLEARLAEDDPGLVVDAAAAAEAAPFRERTTLVLVRAL